MNGARWLALRWPVEGRSDEGSGSLSDMSHGSRPGRMIANSRSRRKIISLNNYQMISGAFIEGRVIN